MPIAFAPFFLPLMQGGKPSTGTEWKDVSPLYATLYASIIEKESPKLWDTNILAHGPSKYNKFELSGILQADRGS
jgi:hypothetical protein